MGSELISFREHNDISTPRDSATDITLLFFNVMFHVGMLAMLAMLAMLSYYDTAVFLYIHTPP